MLECTVKKKYYMVKVSAVFELESKILNQLIILSLKFEKRTSFVSSHSLYTYLSFHFYCDVLSFHSILHRIILWCLHLSLWYGRRLIINSSFMDNNNKKKKTKQDLLINSFIFLSKTIHIMFLIRVGSEKEGKI